MPYIGTHLSLSTKKDHKLYNTLLDAKVLKLNAIQIFTKSPSSFSNTKIDEEDTKLAQQFLKENHMYLVIHGQYIINFCKDPKKSSWGIHSIIQDLTILNNSVQTSLDTGVVIHMGKNVDKHTEEECIEHFKNNLITTLTYNNFIDTLKDNVHIILETSVKSKNGNDIFYTIPMLAKLYKILPDKIKKHIKFCIDTCHVFASGYSLSETQGVKDYFETFDKLIGVKNIAVIHLNDSKNPQHSCLDRHEDLMYGHIFKDNVHPLKDIINFAKKNNIPIITETPHKACTLEEEQKLLKSL